FGRASLDQGGRAQGANGQNGKQKTCAPHRTPFFCVDLAEEHYTLGPFGRATRVHMAAGVSTIEWVAGCRDTRGGTTIRRHARVNGAAMNYRVKYALIA